jgi:mannosyltransferase
LRRFDANESNSELENALSSIKDHERTFNSKFNYPWIFFNDEPFTDDFKKRTSALTKAKTSYEIIPGEHWDVPEWIDREVLADSFNKLEKDDVKYHHLLSYRQMCRWNSGFFFKHPALKDIKWYWRVEPEVHFFCDIDYDVFQFMEMHEKTYGFVISLYDSPKSIRSLWPTVKKFMSQHPEYLHVNNSLNWLQDDAREHHNRIANGYSTCHFWTNFEIANMEFWRSKPYQDFFKALDASGGFMYERWGDAPVHSIAMGLMEDKNKIHFFDDIGYQHIPFFSCPKDRACP